MPTIVESSAAKSATVSQFAESKADVFSTVDTAISSVGFPTVRTWVVCDVFPDPNSFAELAAVHSIDCSLD